jgi:predicted amidophosphoribosyltransferase
LPWWSAGWYEGELRELILRLRQEPKPELLHQRLAPLLGAWVQIATQRAGRQLLLVPIPSWRRQGNPVPALLARALLAEGKRACGAILSPELLLRNRRVAGQHRLNRQQRWRNQWLSFRALLPQEPQPQQPGAVLLIDDVLTSGATALAAQRALSSAGWQVNGLLCLARTPRNRAGRDLGSPSRDTTATGRGRGGPG